MNDALTHLCIEAETGGFQVQIVWPAGRPRYLVFEMVGDTTPRGLAAAIELRELFNSSADRADELFEEFMSTGAVLHPVDDPQKLFPIIEPPASTEPPAIDSEIIFLHDGPAGWAVLTKVERVFDGYIVIKTPAGNYLFPHACGLQRAISGPNTVEAARLDTWIMPATATNRAVYLSRDYLAATPEREIDTLIRHSPPNVKALQ